jgi:hypothetical protein
LRCLDPLGECAPRRDKRGVDLISDALPFGRLWYGEPNAVSNAIGYAKHRSCSHDLLIRFGVVPIQNALPIAYGLCRVRRFLPCCAVAVGVGVLTAIAFGTGVLTSVAVGIGVTCGVVVAVGVGPVESG